MESLYTKYRPHDWDSVIGQESVVKILKRQIETGKIFNCMIFSGVSGTGKTTIARIFANEINKGIGRPIEIDAASNNGVDNVRQITATASERALDSEYKVIIIDECHMMSTAAWNAFLKCIEEPPHYTIFIFCTTEPHKIPETIQNRCMRFNFTRVPTNLIERRLNYICEQENIISPIYKWNEGATNYIARISDGEVRKAISYLETCIKYNNDLSIENILSALGNSSYDDYFILINNLVDGNSKEVMESLSKLYNSGIDMKRFVNLFTDFCFDILKYILCGTVQVTKIPDHYNEQLKFATNFSNNVKYYNYFIDKLISLRTMIKDDSNEFLTIQIIFNQMARFI